MDYDHFGALKQFIDLTPRYALIEALRKLYKETWKLSLSSVLPILLQAFDYVVDCVVFLFCGVDRWKS